MYRILILLLISAPTYASTIQGVECGKTMTSERSYTANKKNNNEVQSFSRTEVLEDDNKRVINIMVRDGEKATGYLWREGDSVAQKHHPKIRREMTYKTPEALLEAALIMASDKSVCKITQLPLTLFFPPKEMAVK